MSDPTLDRLLDALTQAAETGHGYLPARKAVVEHVERLRAQLDGLKRALQATQDDLGPLV